MGPLPPLTVSVPVGTEDHAARAEVSYAYASRISGHAVVGP